MGLGREVQPSLVSPVWAVGAGGWMDRHMCGSWMRSQSLQADAAAVFAMSGQGGCHCDSGQEYA